MVTNIGNAIAINVSIYDMTNKKLVSPSHQEYSAIAKSEKIDTQLFIYTGNQNDLVISFENIKGKSYYIEESIKDDTYKIEKFEAGKYEFPISID